MMASVGLVLPLLFFSLDTTEPSDQVSATVQIESRVDICTDEKTGMVGTCYILEGNNVELVFYFLEGKLHWLRLQDSMSVFTIWER
jgi:hypothetical protein